MTENNLENKVKFFGLYMCQNVLCYNTVETPQSYKLLEPFSVSDTEYLLLKPLKSISDEELLSFAKYYNEKNFNEMIQSFEIVSLGEKFLINQMKELFAIQKNNQYDWSDFQRMYADWFRANGFACEWLKLSIQDLIDYGWIKLKE